MRTPKDNPRTEAAPPPGASAASSTCAEMLAVCGACGGTGDVHRSDGEWLGECQPCVDANLLSALEETAKTVTGFWSESPDPRRFDGHFSTAHLTQAQDEFISMLSASNVLRLIALAKRAATNSNSDDEATRLVTVTQGSAPPSALALSGEGGEQ